MSSLKKVRSTDKPRDVFMPGLGKPGTILELHADDAERLVSMGYVEYLDEPKKKKAAEVIGEPTIETAFEPTIEE
jgi:hypothetical protein